MGWQVFADLLSDKSSFVILTYLQSLNVILNTFWSLQTGCRPDIMEILQAHLKCDTLLRQLNASNKDWVVDCLYRAWIFFYNYLKNNTSITRHLTALYDSDKLLSEKLSQRFYFWSKRHRPNSIKVTLVAIILAFSWMHFNMYPQVAWYSNIGCICVFFLQSEFSSVASRQMQEQLQSNIGSICKLFLHRWRWRW